MKYNSNTLSIFERINRYVLNRIKTYYESNTENFFFKQTGYCNCCDRKVNFIATDSWLRDSFKCDNCSCIPRERALMQAIIDNYPNWKDLQIHESSPGKRGHSVRLTNECKNYFTSQYFPDEDSGITIRGFQNENLEKQTFADSIFDLVVTADVMEHVYDSESVFKEIHRTLKPGGAHIFSVPLINRFEPTQQWAKKGSDGNPVFLFEPEWHGNPVDKKGSPVTWHWGYDIIDHISQWTGAQCKIIYYDNLDLGIRAEFREIIIAKKL